MAKQVCNDSRLQALWPSDRIPPLSPLRPGFWLGRILFQARGGQTGGRGSGRGAGGWCQASGLACLPCGNSGARLRFRLDDARAATAACALAGQNLAGGCDSILAEIAGGGLAQTVQEVDVFGPADAQGRRLAVDLIPEAPVDGAG